ncbi:hydroxymethylglutaryl-CoA lyase [Aspergillus stella-maris]|uniref:hydroxymethylglutaryl-CoA lyase n=1 Tax=Aspergillus stella-maris TaxID=1810926 RepID=UPI003CCCDE8A
MSSIPRDCVRIVEVSPRDGLQNIPEHIPTATKLALIQRLSRTGLTTIEITSIVSPRAVPQLSDCRELLSHENQENPLHLPVLIPNLKGLTIATSLGVRSISVFISATEPFSQNNTKCTVSEGLTRARDVTIQAKEMGMSVRGYISCIFTDPISNTPTDPEDVLRCTRELLEMGVDEVALSDTTGTGTPSLVHSLITYLTISPNTIPLNKLAVHFHDSYSRGLSNVWAAYEAGIRVFDGSVAGLGGCPFAPGARGNVASEEVVGMFEGRGVRTGVDLDMLEGVAGWVRGVLGQYQDNDIVMMQLLP